VNIDGASVNSVALDHDFLSPTSRLLIAGSVGIAHRSGNIMARDTTMMPAIPGLTGLLTLLFCPIVELRVNDTVTEYTGALSGLGLDPITREPIYGDHDMEVIFDTKIDNEDLNTINSIRMTMNYILRPSCGSDLSNLRHKVISDTLQLLQRPRGIIDECWPQTPHMWGERRDGILILCPGAGRDKTHTDVFQLHEGISLD
jgi:ATP-dependent RNA helicase TDRD9